MKSSLTNAELHQPISANLGLLSKVKQHVPEHPALSRMRAKMMQSSGVQVISAYDRMHHRHSRS